MFNSTATRLLVVAAFLPVTYLVTLAVGAGLKLPAVELPGWRFDQLPMRLGEGESLWQGREQEMEDRITAATEAAKGTTTSRLYQDASGHGINMYGAMFDNPAGGVYHTPINCYRASGWQKTDEDHEPLDPTGKVTFPAEVDVSTWESPNGERLIVVYWYQLGDHVLFGRGDLGLKIRWAMRGQPTWPALIKVMMSIPAPEVEDAKLTILNFARQVAVWVNEQEHRGATAAEKQGKAASPRSGNQK
jgi:EpsI family protein